MPSLHSYPRLRGFLQAAGAENAESEGQKHVEGSARMGVFPSAFPSEDAVTIWKFLSRRGGTSSESKVPPARRRRGPSGSMKAGVARTPAPVRCGALPHADLTGASNSAELD